MSRRPNAELGDRDRRILELVGLTGVAGSQQIERWVFADPSSTALSTARRSRRVLARLHRDGYLLRLDRRLGGVRAGSSGWLYQLSTRGKRVIGLSGRGRTWEPGARFVDHALAVLELHLRLVEAERSGGLSDLRVAHEPAIWRRFTTASGPETLKPDLLVELTTADGWELRWFVEVDRGTEHLPTVLAKCQIYERYWRSGHEAAIHEVFPRVCWSVPSENRAAAISRAIHRASGVTDDLFRVATAEETPALLANTNQNSKGGQP